ncbi:MAG TPA: sigma 54-interacting transcriptional regulator [Candidatus Binatia bacterium]
MIRQVESDPPPIKAADEVQALSTLFDRAYVSFVELVQARRMLDSVNEGVVALDRAGRIAGMNLKAREILELSSEVRRQKLGAVLGETPDNEMMLAIVDNALSGCEERAHNHVPLRLRSGKEMLVSLKVSPLGLTGNADEFLGMIISFKEQLERTATAPEIIGKSPHLTEVLDLIAKVAPTDSKVLITGESGTGKELVANAVHRLSQRCNKPFIKINCAAIPEALLESELFGHEKGAFTGAVTKKLGKFDLADGGTIFLDEIGDMSPPTQAKLLRVIQEHEFIPVGGNQTMKVDVRLIAASNRDLFLEVREGRFREDLFYRLNVITLNLPPLRARKSDIPFLVDHFLEETAAKAGNGKKSLSLGAMNSLLAYSWPGNIRELENAIERAFILSNGSVIQAEDLPALSWTAPGDPQVQPSGLNGERMVREASLNETMEAVEKELIIQALKKSDGVQVEAAKILGLNHKNLWHKIRKHHISPSDLKNSDNDPKNGQ